MRDGAEPDTGSRLDVLVFEVAGHSLGISASATLELLRATAITRLPRGPDVVEGLVDVRGKALPVFDLRRRFGWPPKAVEPSDHLVMARAGERLALLRVDRAVALVSFPTAEIEDASAIVAHADRIAGIAHLPDGLVLLHDLATFLSHAEAEALDRATAQ